MVEQQAVAFGEVRDVSLVGQQMTVTGWSEPLERFSPGPPAPHRIVAIPVATHLFEEPGALERVAELADDWFDEHLRAD